METKIAIVNIMDGAPDPYNLNDAITHVRNKNINPFTNVSFDWVNINNIDGTLSAKQGKPTHYVVCDSILNCNPEDVIMPITNAMSLTRMQHELGNKSSLYTVPEPNDGIIGIDLDVEPSEVRFLWSKYPTTWIHAIWRS